MVGSATFAIATTAVGNPTVGTLSATYAGTTKNATFTVNPAAAAALTSLALTPTSVVGGVSVTATVTLSANAPAGGVVVALSSSNTNAASVPGSVTVAAGTNAKTITVTTFATKRNTSATIAAAYLGVTKSAALTVKRR